DCEEFVLAKMVALVDIGIPRGALSIASVETDAVYHAVLLVATDQGDFVLDNLNPNLTRWDLLKEYRFLARESADDPLQWTPVYSDNFTGRAACRGLFAYVRYFARSAVPSETNTILPASAVFFVSM